MHLHRAVRLLVYHIVIVTFLLFVNTENMCFGTLVCLLTVPYWSFSLFSTHTIEANTFDKTVDIACKSELNIVVRLAGFQFAHAYLLLGSIGNVIITSR